MPEEPTETPETENPNEPEMQPVNLGDLGNYFDVARNNYFEANRVIFMNGPITWELGIHIIQKLCFYDDGSKNPITIYISSPGGECDAGFAIIDCINELKRKEIEVHTICIGSCSSMASVILASGTIGHRYAFPSSRIMIHQAGIEATGGKLNDINIIQHELQVWTDNMNKIFKKQTGKDLDELKTLTSYDNYMSASEAKKLGLIDKVKTKLI
jgi:ATP-dependent Clp protease protease subunit